MITVDRKTGTQRCGQFDDIMSFEQHMLTTDHLPSVPKENKRIYKFGGEVRPITIGGQVRVWARGKDFPGVLFTRSIGDHLAHTIGVTHEPGISLYILLLTYRY